MQHEIKALAESSLKLQNKDVMDSTLRKIIAVCDDAFDIASIEPVLTVEDYAASIAIPCSDDTVLVAEV